MRVRDRLRRRLRDGLQVPTTLAGVERILSYLVVGLRLGTVVLMVPSLGAGLDRSPEPALYAACWFVTVGAAVAVSIATVVRGRDVGPVLIAADLLLMALILGLSPVVVIPEQRLGTWIGFQPGMALAVVNTAAASRSRAAMWVGFPAILVGYCVHLYGVEEANLVSTAVGNLLTLCLYALIVGLVSTYLRRLAADADEARAQAAELGRREEQRRAQVVMHNGAAVLRLLSEPELTPAARAVLVDQAMVELSEMRAYLGRESVPPGPANDGQVPVARLLSEARARFADLEIDTVTDPGSTVDVSPAAARALARALDSLLLNVRAHARAGLVVLHLDEDHGRWVLTVSDDGVGFDPVPATFGVGLRDVVLGELDRHGLQVAIDARRGDGTMVTITGRRG